MAEKVMAKSASNALWIAAGVVAIALVVITFGWSIPALRRTAQATPLENIRGATQGRIEVTFLDAPAWMTPADLEPLQDLVACEAGTMVYDRDGLARVQEALLNTGWFDEVRQVRRLHGAVLEVDATFAEPTALVVDRDGEHLLDSRGRLMPRTYAPGTSPPLTRILGASLPRPSRPGQAWGGADLLAGNGMAILIGTQRWRAQISAVDVSEFKTRQTLGLVTTKGCRINWGRNPGSEAAAEVPAAQKLRYLDLLANQYGRVDGASEQTIDLSVDYVASH
ncbi:MAG: hypothetical protein EXS15_05015 [Phycisphaerales bacterium]|nr:hypothetical protein [Phycisphaerales bacterium]